MKNNPFARFTFIGIVLAFIGGLIPVQMIRIQLSPEADKLIERAAIFQNYNYDLEPERGLIYDRYGNLLVGNRQVYQIGLDLKPQLRGDPQTIAALISSVTGADYASVLARASMPYSYDDDPTTPDSVYAVLADFVTEDQIAQISNAVDAEIDYLTKTKRIGKEIPKLNGLLWTPHLMRYYPESSLASNIIGFYSRKNEAFFGLEERYDQLLSGATEEFSSPVDPLNAQLIPDLPPGASLITTIDREIQAAIEDLLDEAVADAGGESGTIVVMDPKTGEILAMVTTPRIDPNRYWTIQDVFGPTTPYNRAVSQTYEPGSVFKILTMAAGLDSGTVTPDTTYYDSGTIVVGGIPIHNWDYAGHGEQSMTGCMQLSLNVCLAWLATKMGPTTFYNYLDAFGVGHLTGIDLAQERIYPLRRPGDSQWFEVDLATNSYGQGVSVTPIQMVMAVSAVANNSGVMFQPHLVKSIIYKGHQYNIEPNPVGTPIKPETARTLTNMLARSIEEETTTAQVEGYRIAGKTGTADIPTEFGYTSGMTNASFVGWGPIDDPRFLVYVWIEKPTKDRWGSTIAAPIFRDVVRRLVVLMDIPPDTIRRKLAKGD